MLYIFVFIALLFSSFGLAQTNSDPLTKVVAIKQLEPFVMQKGKSFQGFSIDLWEEIAKTNAWKTEYKFFSSVQEVIEAVRTKQADIGIAGISMTEEREKLVDFSYPMFNAGLQIMVPERNYLGWLESVKNVFSGDLLRIFAVMLGIIIFAGHVIWLVERRIDISFPRGYWQGISEGIWRASITIATGGFGDRSPKTGIGRVVAFSWVILGVVLVSNLTAAITTNLTVQQIQGNIQNPSDLYGKRVLTVTATTASTYLKQQNITFQSVVNVEEAYRLLEQNKADALVYDSPVLLAYANGQGRGRVRVVGSTFKREFYGIALQSGSGLREVVNRTLLELINGDVYSSLYTQWFGDH